MVCIYQRHCVALIALLAIDGVIVASTIQDQYLDRKKTWTRKLVLITDGESPLELEDWQMTATNLNEKNVQFTIMCVLRFNRYLPTNPSQWRRF